MKRVNHKCPGAYGKVDGFPGNCRNVSSDAGTPYCSRHQDFCDIHRTTWMKSSKRFCPGCSFAAVKERYDLRDGPRKEKISYEEFEVTGSKKGKTRTASSEHLETKEKTCTEKKTKKHTAKGGRRVSGRTRSASLAVTPAE